MVPAPRRDGRPSEEAGQHRIDHGDEDRSHGHVDQVGKLEVITGRRQFRPVLVAKANAGGLPRMGADVSGRLAEIARAAGSAWGFLGMIPVPLPAVFAFVVHVG